jgi:hypothetical protein
MIHFPADVMALTWEAVSTRYADRILEEAYARARDEFARILRETGAYQHALDRALAGASSEQVRMYLLGYATAYLGGSALRARGATPAFEAAYRQGFEQGGRDQLSAWGFRGERFRLRDRFTRAALDARAANTAAYAFETLDGRLLDQATASVMRADSSPSLDVAALALGSAAVVAYRAYNEGRAETATRSVPDEGVMKTWAVLGTAKEPREHHSLIEGMTIMLHDLFPVAGGVRWPHDWDMAGAEEWVYCRHFAEYRAPEGAHVDPWWGEEVDLP